MVRDNALTYLKSKSIENVNILSVDSTGYLSTKDFKEYAKSTIDTMHCVPNTADSFDYVYLATDVFNEKIRSEIRAKRMKIDAECRDIEREIYCINGNIQSVKDTAGYVYKVEYSCKNIEKDSLFVYCSADFKNFNFSKERNNSLILGKRFLEDYTKLTNNVISYTKLYWDYLMWLMYSYGPFGFSGFENY